MSLAEQRRAIRPLLDENSPADATEVYFAFHHPDQRVRLAFAGGADGSAGGYVCLARTGMDLFRPLVTMRLPSTAGGLDLEDGRRLLTQAFKPSQEVILSVPRDYQPLLEALLRVRRAQLVILLVLDRGRFEPLLNILVAQTEGAEGLPRFVIRRSADGRLGLTGETAAAAGFNWRTPVFADVYVNTQAGQRRQGLGRSVLNYALQRVLEGGRRALYTVAADNEASIKLAESAGFVDIGLRRVLLEASPRENSDKSPSQP
ncbi:MAG: GNAT family N-acetyltransferase [Candidatus Promineifilaceae bacterium]